MRVKRWRKSQIGSLVSSLEFHYGFLLFSQLLFFIFIQNLIFLFRPWNKVVVKVHSLAQRRCWTREGTICEKKLSEKGSIESARVLLFFCVVVEWNKIGSCEKFFLGWTGEAIHQHHRCCLCWNDCSFSFLLETTVLMSVFSQPEVVALIYLSMTLLSFTAKWAKVEKRSGCQKLELHHESRHWCQYLIKERFYGFNFIILLMIFFFLYNENFQSSSTK